MTVRPVGRLAGRSDWTAAVVQWAARLRASAEFLRDGRWPVVGLLLLAGLLRLPGLSSRGMFDADQGSEMIAFADIFANRQLPLVGPLVSVGDFHQGALYYYVFAPFAALAGGDPVGVLLATAALGVAAVLIVWWLARAIGGPAAGLVAAMLMALSPAAIESSTTIWSASPLPFCGALAFAAAWHARTTGRQRWWAVALGAAGAAAQIHLLGVLVAGPVLALAAVQAVEVARAGERAALRRLAGAGLAGVAVVAIIFAPLAIHELQTGFSELRQMLAYASDGRGGAAVDLTTRLQLVLIRALSWPLAGVITDQPLASLAAVAVVVVAVGATLLARARAGAAASGAGWLLAILVWGVIGLAVAAPSLEAVVPELPNDHYHSFLLPVIAVLVALGCVAAYRRLPAAGLALLVVAVAICVVRWPAPVHASGGWAAARDAGREIVAWTGAAPVAVLGVPDFKATGGITYPIRFAGGAVAPIGEARYVVVACDRAFERHVGLACGGPAEAAVVGQLRGGTRYAGRLDGPLKRIRVSPRIVLTLYER